MPIMDTTTHTIIDICILIMIFMQALGSLTILLTNLVRTINVGQLTIIHTTR